MTMEPHAVVSTSVADDEIGPMDVLCARGKGPFNRPGNQRFRSIVDQYIQSYVDAESRTAKSEIITQIFYAFKEGGARFLKRDGKQGQWYVLNETRAKDKIGHTIRDATISQEARRRRIEKRKMKRLESTPHEKSKKKGTESPTPSTVKSALEESRDQETVKSALLRARSKMSQVPADAPSSMKPYRPSIENNFGEAFTTLQDAFLGVDQFMAYIDQVLGPL